MLNKISGWYGWSEQMRDFAEEMERMLNAYGWQDEVVHPYQNCPVKLSKMLSDFREFDLCTDDSKVYLVELANGLPSILNEWERYELAPKVKVRDKNGKVFTITEEWLEPLEGLVEIVQE